MAFAKKTWKDRLVEHAGRRQLKRISGDANGTMVVDVTRSEGTVSQAGDAFSAANMNDLEQRIGDGFSEINSNLELPKITYFTATTGTNYNVGCYYYVKGRRVRINIYLNVGGAISSAVSIYTMPENLRPTLPANVICSGGSVSSTASIQVSNDGVIRVATTGNYVIGYLEYDI